MKRHTSIQGSVLEAIKSNAKMIDKVKPKDSGELIAGQLMLLNQVLAVIADRLTEIAVGIGEEDE